MRFPLRFSARILAAAVLAAPLAIAGCHHHHAPPASAAPDDASYRQWEQETNREHRDLNQRTADEKRQYDDWRREHDHR
ncbi:MAG: hypothetical protein WCF17_15410 [Terracidiphilus sp.]